MANSEAFSFIGEYYRNATFSDYSVANDIKSKGYCFNVNLEIFSWNLTGY